jgi:DNA modification methylase
MVAAEQLGRVCRMVEISEAYCAVILQRMSDLGLEPERVNGA